MGIIVTFKNVDFSQVVEELPYITFSETVNDDKSKKLGMVVSEENYTIRYTTDGSTPTLESPIYTAPFNVYIDTTVKAKAFPNGEGSQSDVFTKEVVVGSTVIINNSFAQQNINSENPFEYNLPEPISVANGRKIAWIISWEGNWRGQSLTFRLEDAFARVGNTTVSRTNGNTPIEQVVTAGGTAAPYTFTKFTITTAYATVITITPTVLCVLLPE